MAHEIEYVFYRVHHSYTSVAGSGPICVSSLELVMFLTLTRTFHSSPNINYKYGVNLGMISHHLLVITQVQLLIFNVIPTDVSQQPLPELAVFMENYIRTVISTRTLIKPPRPCV